MQAFLKFYFPHSAPGCKDLCFRKCGFLRADEERKGSSISVLIGAAMVLRAVVMGILCAYARHRFHPVLFVGIGLTTAMGFMGLTGIKLNMAVMGAFPVMIGLGIDYSMQFHARPDEEARKGLLDKVVSLMVTGTGPAVMYAMPATGMGFIAMCIPPAPMICSFGLVAMIGVMSCFVISLIGILTTAHLLNYTPRPQKNEICYAVGEGACDFIPSQTNGNLTEKPQQKSPWSY